MIATISLVMCLHLLAFAGLWQHRQIKQLRRKLAELTGAQQAHQGLIEQLWRERIDIGRQISFLMDRDELIECKIGRDGAIHGQIKALWKRLEEVAPSRETVDA